MKSNLRIGVATLVTCLLLMLATGVIADDPLVAGFRDPPNEARPSAYWLWLNGYVNREHVERELQELHDAGIRGVCIFERRTKGSLSRCGLTPMDPCSLSFASRETTSDPSECFMELTGGAPIRQTIASSNP